MANIEKKRQYELHTVHLMLEIYCHGKHHQKKGLCPVCEELWQYVQQRVARCPHMATKTFCSACKTHCYAPARQGQIREVMRYSGPRMLWHAPRLALYHLYIQAKTALAK